MAPIGRSHPFESQPWWYATQAPDLIDWMHEGPAWWFGLAMWESENTEFPGDHRCPRGGE
jgi:hypothetical protein